MRGWTPRRAEEESDWCPSTPTRVEQERHFVTPSRCSGQSFADVLLLAAGLMDEDKAFIPRSAFEALYGRWKRRTPEELIVFHESKGEYKIIVFLKSRACEEVVLSKAGGSRRVFIFKGKEKHALELQQTVMSCVRVSGCIRGWKLCASCAGKTHKKCESPFDFYKMSVRKMA